VNNLVIINISSVFIYKHLTYTYF